MKASPRPVREGARVVANSPDVCAEVAAYLAENGVEAHGDYREENHALRIRDAINDQVAYVIIVDWWHWIAPCNLDRKRIGEITVTVYDQQSSRMHNLSIDRVIRLIQNRRIS